MTDEDEDRIAWTLRRIAERYAMAVDDGDGPTFAAQFTPDGVLESPRGRFVGQAQLAETPAMMRRLYDRTHHAVVGMTAKIDGDVAHASTAGYARHYYRDAEGVERCYEMTLRYEDRFERCERGWLIARRKLTLVGDASYVVVGGAPQRGDDIARRGGA